MYIRRVQHPGGRVGALVLAVIMLVVSSGLFAGQPVQAAAPSDKVVAQPAQPTAVEAKRFSKDDLPVGIPKPGVAQVKEAPSSGAGSPETVTAATYPFAATTGVALENMATGTTQLLAASLDDTASLVTNIGFEYWFDGVRYTQFSVNANGLLRLGPTVVDSGASGRTNNFADGLNEPKISAYWDDLCTSSTGKVHFKVVGSAPSRKLVVEFQNMRTYSAGCTAGTLLGNYQVWLYESTHTTSPGVVEFVYGAIPVNPNVNTGYSVGISSAAASFASVTTSGATVSYAASNNTQTAAIASGTDYKFTPPASNAPSNLTFSNVAASSITLNWTDNATNEAGFPVYISTDNVNFSFVAQAAANATSINITGLSPSTTYFFRVHAVSPGVLSSATTGTQATAAPATITANALTGNWSAPATWSGGVVPTANDHVVIPSGAVVTIDTAAAAYSVTVNTGGILQYEATTARTLTVTASVTVNTGGTFQSAASGTQVSHVLSVGANLTNNGTLDFSTNTNTAGAGITFTGVVSNTFGGTGTTTDIRTITINKGTSPASILELNTSNFTVRGVNTDVAGFLTLTNGTFKISGTFTMTNRVFTSATYIIGATTGIWLNNPNFTVTGQSGGTTTSNNGLDRVSQGTSNIGVGAGDGMGGGAGAVFIIEGGTVNASGRIDPQSAVTYTQSGGVVNVGTVGNTRSNFGTFELFSTSSVFNMSGGTINIVQPGTALTKIDYQVLSSSGVVSGGTLNIGTGATAAGSTFNIVGNAPN
ncbi:MAG TPA: fibronectin type III domain-containing protein, partial [Chloroflexia bacterium]|nr:fibronectin type III domain-containing protein [Chloroflexia bacterium]